VERFGQYTYVTTYAALFGVLSSLGLYLVLAREDPSAGGGSSGGRRGAKHPKGAHAYFLLLIMELF